VKLPRDLSGCDLAKALIQHWDYRQVNQVGSHIVLQTDAPTSHRISVPDHDALRVGTLNAILRAVAKAKGVSREELVARL
jgi:predicted RNA binding protein YcfA (HicA-like mRNA interferase family)